MDKATWNHLFVEGEYAARARILAGLSLAQVRHRAAQGGRSIFEELWHANAWQAMLLEQDAERLRSWRRGECWPAESPVTSEEWNRLVDTFLTGLEATREWAASPERVSWFLRVDGDPTLTSEAVVYGLAVHTGYHMGKIVALRQSMAAWPPEN